MKKESSMYIITFRAVIWDKTGWNNNIILLTDYDIIYLKILKHNDI